MTPAPLPADSSLSIRSARRGDLSALTGLLSLCGLPPDGVADQVADFLVATHSRRLVGSVGLERYGGDGLLRSLAVHPDYRSRSVGTRLARRALARARRAGLGRVFLLTETASVYFPRFGFQPISWKGAPAAVQASVEFASACPETAVCMELRLA